MSYSYKYLPDVAIADVAFVALGSSIGELFQAAALATNEVMIRIKEFGVKEHRNITIQAELLEELLYKWLSELIYLKDTEHLIFSSYTIVISQETTGYRLQATVRGEAIDPAKHTLGTDVKAVTYHLFEVKEVSDGYEAWVVLDI